MVAIPVIRENFSVEVASSWLEFLFPDQHLLIVLISWTGLRLNLLLQIQNFNILIPATHLLAQLSAETRFLGLRTMPLSKLLHNCGYDAVSQHSSHPHADILRCVLFCVTHTWTFIKTIR